MIRRFLLIIIIFIGVGNLSCEGIKAENVQSKITGTLIAPNSSTNSSSIIEKENLKDDLLPNNDKSESLPNTGVRIKSYLTLTGIMLLLLTIIILCCKNKKEFQDGKKK
ncbi:LPXTG cell wall anchor domain-containing protein [Lactococcus petauri]|uniref:LPXTG cell wall anchor domain-containing protein n=1 Tax=Lactococcus petauri TaxID=1940789 RepID=UPI003852493C